MERVAFAEQTERETNGGSFLWKAEEFIQFMSVDLLTGEYDLKEFSLQEKKSMQMYFNFITACFQKFMGTTTNVQEYMAFKEYYNKLVILIFYVLLTYSKLGQRFTCYISSIFMKPITLTTEFPKKREYKNVFNLYIVST